MPLIAVPDQPPAVQAVVVTAPRLPPLAGDAAFSIVRLSGEAIAGQTRLDEALGQVPGVSLFRRTSSAAANPTTQGVSMRAIAPSGAGRGLVALDGVPQNDPFGGWVIWTSLPTQSIESAQVVRGAGAGPYGAGALTGVVALEELSRPDAIVADAEVGGLGQRRAAVAGTAEVGGAEVFLSASGDHSDGWIPVRAGRGAADDRLSLTDWSAAARVTAPLGRALMSVRLAGYQEERDGGLVGAGSSTRGGIASITLAAQPEADALGWRLQGWVHASDLTSTFVSVAAGRVSTTPVNNQYATPALGFGLNAALQGQAGALTYEVGADVRQTEGEVHEQFRNLGAGFTRGRVAGGRTLVAGLYGEASYVSGPWILTGGPRLDGWQSHGGHRIETNLATGAVTFQDHPADRDGLVPTGRLGVRRELGDGVALRAAGYAGFRPPTLNELYRPFRVGNDITEANGALKPERLFGVETGLSDGEGALRWNATVFLNTLKDPITNVTVGAGPGIVAGFPGAGFVPAGGVLRQRQNAGRIDAWGVEADASYALDSRLDLRAAAAYTHARVDGGGVAPQLTGLRPAQTPRLTLTAGADWRVTDRLGLSGDLRYESARFEDDQNVRGLDSAVTLNARADWRVGGGASLYAAVDNLTDAGVQTGVTADGAVSYDAPRTWRIGVSFRR